MPGKWRYTYVFLLNLNAPVLFLKEMHWKQRQPPYVRTHARAYVQMYVRMYARRCVHHIPMHFALESGGKYTRMSFTQRSFIGAVPLVIDANPAALSYQEPNIEQGSRGWQRSTTCLTSNPHIARRHIHYSSRQGAAPRQPLLRF